MTVRRGGNNNAVNPLELHHVDLEQTEIGDMMIEDQLRPLLPLNRVQELVTMIKGVETVTKIRDQCEVVVVAAAAGMMEFTEMITVMDVTITLVLLLSTIAVDHRLLEIWKMESECQREAARY